MSVKISEELAAIKAQVTEAKKENDKLKDIVQEYEEQKTKMFNQQFSGSREKKLMTAFGASDVKELILKNVHHNDFQHVPLDYKMEVVALKRHIDNSRYISQMFYGQPQDKGDLSEAHQVANVKTILETKYAKKFDLAGQIKNFGTGVVGGGAEWIPTLLSANYIDEYKLEKEVIKLFPEMSMPSNPYKLTLKKDGSKAKIVAEGAPAIAGNFNTDTLTFDCKHKLVEHYVFPEELTEDSIVDIMKVGRESVLESQYTSFDSALINGDDSTTHMDSNVTVASDSDKMWKGLRKLAFLNSVNGVTVNVGGAVTHAKLTEIAKAMGKFSTKSSECVLIVSPSTWHQMVALPEVLTVEKMGALATILSGALAAYMGKAIVISEFLHENQNALGVHDGVTVNKTSLLMVNKTRFMLGYRRPIMVKVAQDPTVIYDRWLMASYSRFDFQGFAQDAKEKSVALGYNISI
jgi:hypothetical protein